MNDNRLLNEYLSFISSNIDARASEIFDKFFISNEKIASLNKQINSNNGHLNEIRLSSHRFFDESCDFVNNNAKVITDFLTGKRVYPLILEFHPGPICNNRCEWCFSAFDEYDQHINDTNTLSVGKFIEICKDCSNNDVREVWFSGGKEPLTNKDFIHFLEIANHYGFKTRLYTNGILLSPKEPAYATCSQIRISVNAAKPETYCKVCGINNMKLFDRLVNTITELVIRKKENPVFGARIAVSFMIQKYNCNEMYDFFEKFMSIGVDSIQFRLDSIGRVPKLTTDEQRVVIDQAAEITDYVIKNNPKVDLSLRGIAEDEFNRELLPELRKPKVCMAGMIKRGMNPWGVIYNCFPAGTRVLIKNEINLDQREGFCKCGCGNETTELTRDFISGHNSRGRKSSIEKGYCLCGCGAKTLSYRCDYISGHNGNTRNVRTVNIEKIKVGDEVLSYNEETSEKEFDKVVKIGSRKVDKILRLYFSNGNELYLTPEHPLAVIDSKSKLKWTEAKNIEIGYDCLQLLYAGVSGRVRNLTNDKYDHISLIEKADNLRKSHENGLGWGLRKHHEFCRGKTWEEIHGNDMASKMHIVASENRKDIEKRLKETDPDYVEKRLKNLHKQSQHPNGAEILLQKWLDIICPDEFGLNTRSEIEKMKSISFNGKRPDFVGLNGKKKIILHHGCQWHDCPYHPPKGKAYMKKWDEETKIKHIKSIENEDIEHYNKLGYDCMIIWAHEVPGFPLSNRGEGLAKSLDDKVKTFIHNPNVEIIKLIKKEEINGIETEVYNIETEKNHNFFAYGILSHNCEYSSHPHFKGESERLILGDVNKDSFADIMSRSLGIYPEVCQFCQAHEYGMNVLLGKLSDDLKFGLKIEDQIFYRG
jgi:organic radical activating enzyme/G:T-mismatch repair DNA endonuclease (very short patch repair protein)